MIPEKELFPCEARHLLYGHKPHVYRVVLMLEGETVYILHVWHGRGHFGEPH